MKFVNGLAFPDADTYLADRLPEQGVWQDDALDAGIRHCRNFRTAVDGGAHVGTWSLALADVFDTVVSFEVAGDTYEALEWNTRGNSRITAYNMALCRKSCKVGVSWDSKDINRQHTGARYATPGEGDVPGVPLDFMRLKTVDFIKFDLEGGEPDAIKGATRTIKQSKPVIVFEDKGFCERRYCYDRDASLQLLTDLGMIELEKCGINRVWGWPD